MSRFAVVGFSAFSRKMVTGTPGAVPSLKRGFKTHLDETQTHVARLEEAFRMHGAEAKGIDCPAIDSIIEEADDVFGEVADKSVMDAAPIAAARAVEHYVTAR